MALLAILTLGIAGDSAAQSWSKKIPNGRARFKVLPQFNREAVLDKETGLLWELEPSTDISLDFDSAFNRCSNLYTGERMGWRLPTFEELASLVDRSHSPALPSGHPFVNITPSEVWSATTYHLNHTDPSVAVFSKTILLGTGNFSAQVKTVVGPRTWCVRGGQGVDGGVNQN